MITTPLAIAALVRAALVWAEPTEPGAFTSPMAEELTSQLMRRGAADGPGAVRHL